MKEKNYGETRVLRVWEEACLGLMRHVWHEKERKVITERHRTDAMGDDAWLGYSWGTRESEREALVTTLMEHVMELEGMKAVDSHRNLHGTYAESVERGQAHRKLQEFLGRT